MSTLSWFPINPSLTESGAFSAFAYEAEADVLKPIPLDKGTDPFSQFRVLQSSFDLEVAGKLGIGIGSINAGFQAMVLSYEAMLFTEKISETPVGGKIYGTRWGAGLRVMLKITDRKADTKLSFGAIAASTELGLARVEYEINGIGINKPEILAVLPGPGDFNFSNYKKILDAVDNVKNYLSKNAKDLQPRPFQIFISEDNTLDLFSNTRSVLFAVKNIIGRNPLKTALANAEGKFSASTIRSVYTKFELFEENQQPSREHKKQAEKFLDVL